MHARMRDLHIFRKPVEKHIKTRGLKIVRFTIQDFTIRQHDILHAFRACAGIVIILQTDCNTLCVRSSCVRLFKLFDEIGDHVFVCETKLCMARLFAFWNERINPFAILHGIVFRMRLPISFPVNITTTDVVRITCLLPDAPAGPFPIVGGVPPAGSPCSAVTYVPHEFIRWTRKEDLPSTNMELRDVQTFFNIDGLTDINIARAGAAFYGRTGTISEQCNLTFLL